MKILHLFSDWKWTGPAEPVWSLCKELGKRGHSITFAYRKPPFPVEDSIEKRILRSDVRVTDQFHLNHVLKPSRPSALIDNLQDLFRLTHYLRQEKFDLLNVHQSHDHALGGIAARWLKEPVTVIRTDHKRDFIKPSFGNRLLISQLTDGIITFSERGRREDAENFNLPLERVGRVRAALDLSRFDSNRGYKNMRTVFGVGSDETVIGMVARFQKYRRTEVFLEAIKLIVKEFPKIKVLLVGRSSQMEESVVQPMKRLGVEPWVILGGYQSEHYIDTLACMDIFVFLMSGSDGTARALREAMAMGKPVIVADRGMLPELVEDGISGWVVKDTPEELARAALRLLKDPKKREEMGKAAHKKAHGDFRLDRQAEEVESFYQGVISLGKWKRR
ncbi:MAG TPA: glycosyltransferase family 4 protein [Thermodesulfobacteriota bacterium]|nr:glycosyltransferase family 4 protein [Thermodesulfobacteriota bacterium]